MMVTIMKKSQKRLWLQQDKGIITKAKKLLKLLSVQVNTNIQIYKRDKVKLIFIQWRRFLKKYSIIIIINYYNGPGPRYIVTRISL
jgi:hypothetical protein